MGLYIFIYIWLATGIRFVFTDCGTISPEQRNVTEGEKVQLKFLPKYGRTAEIWFFYWINSEYNKDICWSSNSSCISEKYHLYNNLLSIENFTKTDEGQYTVKCDSGFWSSKAFLNNQPADTIISQERHVHLKNRPVVHSVTAQVDSKTVTIKVLATTSASNEHELHQKTISLENPKEYHSMTKSATAKIESVSVKTEVSDYATEYKVSSTLGDTGQIITTVFAGGIAIGVLLTVIVVVIIYKKRKKNDIHRAGQKSGPTQTNLKGAEGQGKSFQKDFYNKQNTDGSHRTQQKPPPTQVALEGLEGKKNRVLNDSNHLHRREPSEQEAPAVQLRQVDSKYETIIPVTDRAASLQERELYKMIKVEKENMPEYEAVE